MNTLTSVNRTFTPIPNSAQTRENTKTSRLLNINDVVDISANALTQGMAYSLGGSTLGTVALGGLFSGCRGAYEGYRSTIGLQGSNSDLFPVDATGETVSQVVSGFAGGSLDGMVGTAITAGIVGLLGGGALTAAAVGATWGLAKVGISRWADTN